MTYADLTASLSQVRFLVGDTDTSDEQLTDTEIAYCLSRAGTSVLLAAVYACEGIAAKYARKVTKSVGDLSIQYSDLQKHYQDLASSMRRECGRAAVPVAGGISIARVDAVEADADRVAPTFTVGMLTNPTIGKSTEDEEEE
jgi:hypothetical protein